MTQVGHVAVLIQQVPTTFIAALAGVMLYINVPNHVHPSPNAQREKVALPTSRAIVMWLLHLCQNFHNLQRRHHFNSVVVRLRMPRLNVGSPVHEGHRIVVLDKSVLTHHRMVDRVHHLIIRARITFTADRHGAMQPFHVVNLVLRDQMMLVLVDSIAMQMYHATLMKPHMYHQSQSLPCHNTAVQMQQMPLTIVGSRVEMIVIVVSAKHASLAYHVHIQKIKGAITTSVV